MNNNLFSDFFQNTISVYLYPNIVEYLRKSNDLIKSIKNCINFLYKLKYHKNYEN